MEKKYRLAMENRKEVPEKMEGSTRNKLFYPKTGLNSRHSAG